MSEATLTTPQTRGSKTAPEQGSSAAWQRRSNQCQLVETLCRQPLFVVRDGDGMAAASGKAARGSRRGVICNTATQERPRRLDRVRVKRRQEERKAGGRRRSAVPQCIVVMVMGWMSGWRDVCEVESKDRVSDFGFHMPAQLDTVQTQHGAYSQVYARYAQG